VPGTLQNPVECPPPLSGLFVTSVCDMANPGPMRRDTAGAFLLSCRISLRRMALFVRKNLRRDDLLRPARAGAKDILVEM
jgi:hypothetical protein